MDDASRSLLPPYAAGTSPAPAAGSRSSANIEESVALLEEIARLVRKMRVDHSILGEHASVDFNAYLDLCERRRTLGIPFEAMWQFIEAKGG